MKVIKWSPIEIVEPYSMIQLEAVIQNIKDREKKAYTKQKLIFDETGHYQFIELAEDPSTKIVNFLQERGCKYIAASYPNTEFLFYTKFIKGTYVVYTPPKTPFED